MVQWASTGENHSGPWARYKFVWFCHTVPTQFQSVNLESMEQNQDIIVSIRIFEFHPRLMTESLVHCLEFVYHQYPKNVFKTEKRIGAQV